jgi:beta-glucosidase
VGAVQFPSDFLWGAATSAYQIEGSPLADGAGVSLWHRFSHTPGNTLDDANGDVANDHYNRFREDIAIMRELGLHAYQFSIAWPRVLPEASGRVNQKGLDFYDALTDALLEAGVKPTPILYVWDPPAAMQDRGGWANRDSAEWFAEFASRLFERLGDRATHWFTICEPQSVAHYGYVVGELAPGIRDVYAGLRAAHHLMLAQGRAVQAFRASGAQGEIGNYHALADIQPASELPEDLAAAERANAYVNTLYMDPIMGRDYPESMVEWFGDAWPSIHDGDLATIATPMDFVGISYYCHSVVGDLSGDGVGGSAADSNLGGDTPPPPIGAAGPLGEGLARLMKVRVAPPNNPTTDLEWEIVPDGLWRTLTWLSDRYGRPPIYIGEMGGSFEDTVTADGRVHDSRRLAYIRDHLAAAHRAIADGVDLRACFIWGLMDSFEFNLGFSTRFGLVHIDFETQQRTIKDSGYWFKEVMNTNGFDVPEDRTPLDEMSAERGGVT